MLHAVTVNKLETKEYISDVVLVLQIQVALQFNKEVSCKGI